MTKKWLEVASFDGRRILQEEIPPDYFRLSNFYRSQHHPNTCALASASILLNALTTVSELEPPTGYNEEVQQFTPENVLNPSDYDTKDVKQNGMGLSELASVIEAWPVDVEVYRPTDSEEADLHDVLHSAFVSDSTLAVVNYYRPAVGQNGPGHFSPVSGFLHDDKKYVLVFDVSRYKHQQVLIPWRDLYEAMDTTDSGSDQKRGLITVTA